MGYTEAEIRAAQDIVNERLIGSAPTAIEQPSLNEARKTFTQNLPVIEMNSEGEIVKILQQTLTDLGFYTGDIDGKAET